MDRFITPLQDLPITVNEKVRNLPIKNITQYFEYINNVTHYGQQRMENFKIKNELVDIRIVRKGDVLELTDLTLFISWDLNLIFWKYLPHILTTDAVMISSPHFKISQDPQVLSRMTRGWCIGDFTPSVFRTTDFEVGVLSHKKGEYHPYHIHNHTTEYNYLAKGKMLVNNVMYLAGESFYFPKGHLACCSFEEDVVIVCVKIPSVPNDKVFI